MAFLAQKGPFPKFVSGKPPDISVFGFGTCMAVNIHRIIRCRPSIATISHGKIALIAGLSLRGLGLVSPITVYVRITTPGRNEEVVNFKVSSKACKVSIGNIT